MGYYYELVGNVPRANERSLEPDLGLMKERGMEMRDLVAALLSNRQSEKKTNNILHSIAHLGLEISTEAVNVAYYRQKMGYNEGGRAPVFVGNGDNEDGDDDQEVEF